VSKLKKYLLRTGTAKWLSLSSFLGAYIRRDFNLQGDTPSEDMPAMQTYAPNVRITGNYEEEEGIR